MPKQIGLSAYEERYRLVYETGARFWNEHQPHQRLLELAERLPAKAKGLDLGCGEGHEARYLAHSGLDITAIDLSPSAITKAQAETSSRLTIHYLVGDVTNLREIGLDDDSFDFAVDVGCLHMMAEKEDRSNYLLEVRRVLKPEGIFYLQNGLCLEGIQPENDEERRTIEGLKQFQEEHKPGSFSPRMIQTPQGEKEIFLPLCPQGLMLTLEGYVSELRETGFSVVSSESSKGANMSFEAVIIAKIKGKNVA